MPDDPEELGAPYRIGPARRIVSSAEANLKIVLSGRRHAEGFVAKGALALEMRDISKSFPGVRALEGVSFDCAIGEVHAICGENGAGKSTLIKVLGGVYKPDAGTIRVNGRETTFAHPAAARRAGISIIHQELSLLPHRSVAQNVFLGLEPTRFGRLDAAAMRSGTARLLDRLSSTIDPETKAGELSVAEQQIVEIAKALAVDARILVMDEPTAALDKVDAQRLLALVRKLREEGVAIVYISHRMAELAAVADRITVMKDGRRVATEIASALPTDRIVRLMVGRDLADFYPPRSDRPPGPALLEITGGGNQTLADIDLAVRSGEIVGVAGLEGSGKTALARAIFGDEPFDRGAMRVAGVTRDIRSPRAAIDEGIGFLPDDRKREGLALQQSSRDNVLLTLRAFAPSAARASGGAMADAAADAGLRQLDVRAARFDGEIRLLSGGNQQKVIIGRWLARDPKILLFCEPTRGIDVAAKAAIYQIMRDLASRGRGIVLVSSDLPEVVGISDRILVMREGRIVGECAGGASEEVVMALAVGHRPEEIQDAVLAQSRIAS
jgi:ribose transport system ATP-binding protein